MDGGVLAAQCAWLLSDSPGPATEARSVAERPSIHWSRCCGREGWQWVFAAATQPRSWQVAGGQGEWQVGDVGLSKVHSSRIEYEWPVRHDIVASARIATVLFAQVCGNIQRTGHEVSRDYRTMGFRLVHVA